MSIKRSSAAVAVLAASLAFMSPLAAAAAPGDPAPGFAYSQGWYSTHPTQWPCGVPSTTMFFDSGLTLQQVISADSSKGVYFQLGQQFIAAGVNIYNGAVPTPEVSQAMQTAYEYFSTSTPSTPLTKDQTRALKALIPVLSDFNTAKISGGSAQACQGGLFQMARELKIRQ